MLLANLSIIGAVVVVFITLGVEFFLITNLPYDIKTLTSICALPLAIHIAMMIVIGIDCLTSDTSSIPSIVAVSLVCVFVLFRIASLSILHQYHASAPQLLLNKPTIPSGITSIPVILVIAHPDDESMFFSPFLSMVDHYNKSRGAGPLLDIHIICLTNGNAAGLGVTRTRELHHTAWFAHRIAEDHVTIINDPSMLDSMTARWSISKAQEHIYHHTLRIIRSSSSQSRHHFVYVTFDDRGVSGHINHIDTYLSMLTLPVESFQRDLIDYHMTIWGVTTLSLVYKYLTCLGPLAHISYHAQDHPRISPQQQTQQQAEINGSPGLAPINLYEHIYIPNSLSHHSWFAMSLHHSQFVWFRKLFILFSYYTYTTPLTLLRVYPCDE